MQTDSSSFEPTRIKKGSINSILLALALTFYFAFPAFSEDLLEISLDRIESNRDQTYNFRLIRAGRVYLSSRFYFIGTQTREAASKAIGSAYTRCEIKNTCGEPLAIKFEIKNPGNDVLYSFVTSAVGRDHFTATYFSRPMQDFYLDAGEYNITVVSIQQKLNVELRNVTLVLSTDGRVKIK